MFLKHPRSSNLTLLKLFLAATTVFSLTASSNAFLTDRTITLSASNGVDCL